MVWDFSKALEGGDIVIVDDNIVNLKVLTTVLESNSYSVRCAQSGEEALARVTEKIPDLILLDVQMPGMDGFEVCRSLKEDPETEEIPVIFITASDTVESKIQGFEAGAADYIPRPLQMPEVLARVKNQLTARRFFMQAEEEKERLKKVLAALPVPYLLSSVDTGMLLEVNDHACRKLNLRQDEVQNIHANDIYASPEKRNEILETLEEHELVSNAEIELKKTTGEVFTTLYSATPLQLGEENVFFVAFSDITERKEMEKALEEAARTDYLTGTLNRRSFSGRALDERHRADRNNHSLCLFMLDIDHFKKINDTYGHDVGDDALKELVKLVEQNLRTSDAFGRVGGEEFIILLPETDMEGAWILAERVRTSIEENELEMSTGRKLRMTVSGGLAEWTQDQSYEEVLKQVDECLYKAKHSGRNCVVKG